MKQQETGRGLGLGFWCAVLIVTLGASQTARAQGTNSVPSSWSFESYATGTAIVDTNSVGYFGWQGTPFTSSNNAGEVVAIVPPAPSNGYPLPGETHQKVMQVLGDVSADFDTNLTFSATNIYIDCMVQAGQLPYGNDDGPEPPAGVQVAAFFNTNGLLTVRNSAYTNFFQDITRTWTTIQHTPTGSNDWVRLTITMDYRSAGEDFYNDHYFSVQLNGTVLTSPLAYTNFPVTEADADYPSSGPGTINRWFLCADSGFGNGTPNNRFFSGLTFSGAGNVDDVVITSSQVVVPCGSPFECWVEQFLPDGVRGTGDDPDEDGATNIEEFYNGTDPSNPESVFEVTLFERTGTVSRVQWYGTTNSGFTSTYDMYRSTNLLTGPGGWLLVATNIPRNPSGTNLWFDTNPPPVKSFYHPRLMTNGL